MGEPLPPNWSKVREEALKEKGRYCMHCNSSGDDGIALHVHHIVPRSVGGKHKLENLVILCEQCHYAVHGERRRADYQVPEEDITESSDGSETAIALYKTPLNGPARLVEEDEDEEEEEEETITSVKSYRYYPIWVRFWWWLFGRNIDDEEE
jgi:hypothetical protein